MVVCHVTIQKILIELYSIIHIVYLFIYVYCLTGLWMRFPCSIKLCIKVNSTCAKNKY